VELKTKTEVQEVPMHLLFNLAETVAYKAIDEKVRIRIAREIMQRTQAPTYYLIIIFHHISGFKEEIRACLIKIRPEAMQINPA
jgi:hypothetical protein